MTNYTPNASLEIIKDMEDVVSKETILPPEPVPGHYYRTAYGKKVLYIGKDKYDSFVYQEEDGNFEQHLIIVGKWVDPLPAIEIKRWAVVFTEDGKFVKRGDAIYICPSAHVAKERAAECKVPVEIVELTGTLPSIVQKSTAQKWEEYKASDPKTFIDTGNGPDFSDV